MKILSIQFIIAAFITSLTEQMHHNKAARDQAGTKWLRLLRCSHMWKAFNLILRNIANLFIDYQIRYMAIKYPVFRGVEGKVTG